MKVMKETNKKKTVAGTRHVLEVWVGGQLGGVSSNEFADIIRKDIYRYTPLFLSGLGWVGEGES
jgi:hypothetical protein